MPGNSVQSFISSLSEGRGLFFVRGLIVVLAILVAVGIYAGLRFRGLTDGEAMEQAQLGRNFAEGRGFVTLCRRPLDLWYLERNDKEHQGEQPDIRHAPAYPFALSLGLRIANPSYKVSPDSDIFPAERKVIVPVCVIFYAAAGLMVFLLALKLFDVRVAVVSLLAFALSKTAMDQCISGMPDSLTTFLVTAAFYFACLCNSARARGCTFAKWGVYLLVASLVTGLAFLSDYRALVILPGVVLCVVAAFDRLHWLAGLFVVLIAGAVVFPWLMRNQEVSGGYLGLAPYSALEGTYRFPGDTLDRQYDPPYHRSHIMVAAKNRIGDNLASVFNGGLRTAGQGLLVCFFLVSFFLIYEDSLPALMKWGTGLTVVAGLFVAAMSGPDSGSFSVLWGIIAVMGAGCFFLLMDRHGTPEPYQAGLAVALVALSAFSSVMTVIYRRPESPYPPYFPPFVSYVCGMVEEDQTLCTDIPEATAWYGRQRSMQLPVSVEQFVQIANSGINFGGVYLTTRTGNKDYIGSFVEGSDSSWLPLLNRRVPGGFPFNKGVHLPVGARHQLFLSDEIEAGIPVPTLPEKEDEDEDKETDIELVEP